MYKPNKRNTTTLRINNSVEGETIEQKVKRALTSGEGITDSASVIYTERKDGVLPEYNPRTDKWEIAVDAMDKIQRDNTAKRQGRIIEMNQKNEPKTDPKNAGNGDQKGD